MRISAVIPAYNCAQYIGDAIRSVLQQTLPVHELIVVDDGSTDGTAAVVREFLNDVRYIRTANKGVAAARNTALTCATGDVIGFLDADDLWYRRKLEWQLQVLEEQTQVQAVCSEFDLVDQGGRLLQKRYLKEKYRVFRAYGLDWPDIFANLAVLTTDDGGVKVFHGDAFRGLFLGNFVNTSSMLVRRDALDRAGHFTPGRRTQEDYEAWLKLALGGSMAFIDHPLLLFRRRPNQLTSSGQRLQIARDVVEVVTDMAGTARTRLGERTVARRLARLHLALAVALLGTRQPAQARRAMRQAYECEGPSVRLTLLYSWSWMPASAADRLRTLHRRMRGGAVRASL